MKAPLVLVSHVLCPYVQRASIVLLEKGVAFERRDVDLACKPDWLLKASPLGKTPMLLVNERAIFESAVICEYLEETEMPRMHPEDALDRAHHRAWVEFASAVLATIGAFYNARDDEALAARAQDLRTRFEQVEDVLGEGPFFAGRNFSLVDAAFAPVFRYFDVLDRIDRFGWMDGLVRVLAWRAALQTRASVRAAVSEDYPELLRAFLRQRSSALSRRMEAVAG
jgi:glutathione S-transferase